MSHFFRIRNSIHYRHYFDAVHPLFWPVLYWQLGRILKWFRSAQISAVCLRIHWWGGITIRYCGDTVVEAPPNPFALLRPRWDDPVWSSDVPLNLETNRPVIRPCEPGEVSPEMTEEALCSPNTS